MLGVCGEIGTWIQGHDLSTATRLHGLPRRVLASALAAPGVMFGIFGCASLETKQPEAVKVRLDAFVADVVVSLDVIAAANHSALVTCENKGE